MKFARLALPVLVVAATLAAGAGSATASATSATTSPTVTTAGDSTDIAAGTTVTLPNGKVIQLPKNWSQLSISDLARIGIHPGMGHATITVRPPKAGGVTANSASGCNDEVCIYVGGSGLIVQSWETTGLYDGPEDPFCTYAVYWAPGDTIYATGWEVCGGLGTYYGYEQDTPIAFYTTTEICNTWVGIPGKPCEWVHS